MMKKTTVLAGMLMAAQGSMALAGGLWLNEGGDFSGGRSSAGAVAGVDDASTLRHNPASGMRLEGKKLFVFGGAVTSDIKFDIDYTNPVLGEETGGNAGTTSPAGGFAYHHDTGSEHWSLGVHGGALAGSALDYNKSWVGRIQATEVTLALVELSPVLAYQLTDRVSIGGTIQFYYSDLDINIRVPRPLEPGAADRKVSVDGDEFDMGYSLGALFEFSEHSRLGIYYQSELDPNYDGDLKGDVLDVEVESDTELTLAQFIRVGLHHALTDQLSIELTFGWEDWSALDNVFLSLPETGANLEKNWHDTYHYAAGFQYQIDQDWTVTSGISYDTNPVDAEDRTADLPVDRKVSYSAGLRYRMSDALNIGGYVNYTDLGSAKIRADTWGGEYSELDLYQLAIFADWSF